MRTVGFELILDALDVSLDLRKVAFTMAGLFVTGAVSGLLSYIALAAGDGILAIVLIILAGLIAWILSNLVYGTVAKMSYDELSRRPSEGWQAALGYAARHLLTLLFSPLVLLIVIILVVVVEGAILLVGRIPYLGELWASLLFLPLVLLNLFLILLSSLGVWLIPAVVAGDGGGIIDTLRRVQQAVRRAPGRLLAYMSIAVILGILAALIIIPLVYTATSSTIVLTVTAMVGPDMVDLVTDLVDLRFDNLPYELEGVLRYDLGFGSDSDRITLVIAGAIFAVALLLIPIAILAVLFIVFPVSCACATYLSVRQDEPEPPVPQRTWEEPTQTSCSNCGAEVSPQARFCLRCGHPQEPG